MRAWVVAKPGPMSSGPLELTDRQAEPGPGELLVRVIVCGVCRTDLHLFAPAGTIVPAALAALDRNGTPAVAGIYLTDIRSLNYEKHLFQKWNLRSVTSNTHGDAQEFLTLAERLKIKVTATPYPFSQADQALADLEAERVHGAAVLQM